MYQNETKKRYITSPQKTFIMTTILKDIIRYGTGEYAHARGISGIIKVKVRGKMEYFSNISKPTKSQSDTKQENKLLF